MGVPGASLPGMPGEGGIPRYGDGWVTVAAVRAETTPIHRFVLAALLAGTGLIWHERRWWSGPCCSGLTILLEMQLPQMQLPLQDVQLQCGCGESSVVSRHPISGGVSTPTNIGNKEILYVNEKERQGTIFAKAV